MECWEIIADRAQRAGWILGCVSAVDSEVRSGLLNGTRFLVHADEKLSTLLNSPQGQRVFRPQSGTD
jgi:hypothetical protein